MRPSKKFTPEITAGVMVAIGLILTLSQGLSTAWGEEDSTPSPKKSLKKSSRGFLEKYQAPCAVLRNHEGTIRILDESRKHMIDPAPQTGLPCGSWVSTEDGWAEIHHQNGSSLHLGPNSFAQLTSTKGDQLILYRGQVYADVSSGDSEFKIVSEVGRVRLKNGKIIFISDHVDNETQLIVLTESASLENRFQPSHKMRVHGGETSSLNFKLLRVIPSTPTAVSVASLKPKLEDLEISDKIQTEAIRTAMMRQQRSVLARAGGSRSIASDSSGNSGSEGNYSRNPTDPADRDLEQHLIEKTTGGAAVSPTILFPDKFYGKTQKIDLEFQEPTLNPKYKQKKNEEEEREKKRLMQELSRIHAE